jgi:hypothetical protein
MVESASAVKTLPRQVAAASLVTLGLALSGCADMNDSMTVAFADPAKYELYNCKQLEPERKRLAVAEAEVQGLMAKAETGVAGPVVSELAYRNDYIMYRAQARLADEAWRKNKCHETPAAATTAAPAANARPDMRPDIKPAPPSRSGSAVY